MGRLSIYNFNTFIQNKLKPAHKANVPCFILMWFVLKLDWMDTEIHKRIIIIRISDKRVNATY